MRFTFDICIWLLLTEHSKLYCFVNQFMRVFDLFNLFFLIFNLVDYLFHLLKLLFTTCLFCSPWASLSLFCPCLSFSRRKCVFVYMKRARGWRERESWTHIMFFLNNYVFVTSYFFSLSFSINLSISVRLLLFVLIYWLV